MLYDESLRTTPPDESQVVLWRFMVDAQFRGQGIGAAAPAQVIPHV
jgi:GNAT superfamily N-acetyltransferase